MAFSCYSLKKTYKCVLQLGFHCVFCFKTTFNDIHREKLNSVQKFAVFDLFDMFTQLIKVSFFLYANIYTLDEKKLQSPGVHKYVNIPGNKKKITKNS